MKKKVVNVGLIGCGTVGSGVVRLFKQNGQLINSAAGIEIKLKKVCDLKNLKLPGVKFTRQVSDILEDAEIEVVIEAVGGIKAAKDYIVSALKAGKNVVTPNKEAMAKYGDEVLKLARANQVEILFEGSVGGGIPILKPLKESLAANNITEIFGIVNGTSNYILSKMEKENKTFKVALTEAQAKGYAEANPDSDISGLDAAYKAIILAAVGFDAKVSLSEIFVEGISKVTLEDIHYAKEIGYSIKLLAILKRVGGELEVRVHPTLIPLYHPLASILEANNAICVKGDAVGELMFSGEGAGSLPTASAVLSDVIDISRRLSAGVLQTSRIRFDKVKIRNIAEINSRYYVRFKAPDKPGVLASISGIFGSKNVSIQAAMQKETVGDVAQIVIIIHSEKEKNVQDSLSQIKELPNVTEVVNVIRVGLE